MSLTEKTGVEADENASEVMTLPRPSKRRKVCKLPGTKEFRPVGELHDEAIVTLSVDEFEAVRLIDRQGFSQEECGRYMQVSRTTVQTIYNSARKKIARALVEGMTLRINGGNTGSATAMRSSAVAEDAPDTETARRSFPTGEEKPMKIAVSVEENKTDVCPFAARSPYFLLYENGTSDIVENPAAQAESGAGIQAAQFLIDNEVTHFIAVRVGGNAAEVFKAAGIPIYTSEHKTAAEDIAALEAGRLEEQKGVFEGFHGAIR